MSSQNQTLRDKLLHSDDFVVTFELVPGRTRLSKRVRRLIDFAKQAASDKRLDALSLTDNPGGNPQLSPDELGREIVRFGMDTIIHVTCRDANRLGLFSRAQQLESMGVRNLLALTGDYPSESDSGVAKPCFDLDSVTLLCFLNQLNGHSCPRCMDINTNAREKTHFFLGAGVSCTKYSESEQIPQYGKLVKKALNGAQYFITQLGYDARKFHELIQFASEVGVTVPILGSVYILSEPAARFMNSGSVPGAYVSDRLHESVAAGAGTPDKGRHAELQRAAKLMAVLKGIGYRGAHIGGNSTYDEICLILDTFEEIKHDWQSFVHEFAYGQPDGFYLYEKDEDTGLNGSDKSLSGSRSLNSWFTYRLFEGFHKTAFNEANAVFPFLKGIAKICDSGPLRKSAYGLVEHISKKALFGCKMCGDCALSSMAYVCPESRCPKFQRNGACGGSSNTHCEVFPDRQCAWVAVFKRLHAVQKVDGLENDCMPPRNWSLDKTSSWLNFYLSRDHQHTGNEACQGTLHPR